MKKISFIAIAGLVMLNSCRNSTTNVEVKNDSTTVAAKKETKAVVKPDSATAMKNWMEYMTPGPMQQMLAASDGNWVGETSMWMSPDAPPEKTTLTATHEMILGGRYQVVTHKGTMMGMPFEGVSTTAYDNARKKFINTWIDNTGTGVMYLEGTWDEATKSITYTGKMVAADMGDGTELGVKQVFKFVDETHQEFVMYMVEEDGKETKTMEVKYTKK